MYLPFGHNNKYQITYTQSKAFNSSQLHKSVKYIILTLPRDDLAGIQSLKKFVT